MFANKKIVFSPYTGNSQTDHANLTKAISDYLSSLEQKNALAIVKEGKWTPVPTFATPGDLSVIYSTQYGYYWLFGNQISVLFRIVTSSFTHTTASGILKVTGLPLTSENTTGKISVGSLNWGGITKATY